MEGNYSWKSYYTELADKLLNFRSDRSRLIDNLYQVFDKSNLNVPKFEIDNSKPEDMDPFTVFSLFNRGITNANREKLAKNMKELWGLRSDVPS